MKANINEPDLRTSPFGNIALTFSGGGFRAAAFSLGALSYLNEFKIAKGDSKREVRSLLDNVSYIASTSGGSITNAMYSAYIHKGKTFLDVYHKLKNDLTGQNLLEQVVAVLTDDKQWNQSGDGKQRNFINAFAKVYDSLLYEGETFGIFWKKDYVPGFEVCFNSTEFYRGLSFRFQTEGDNNRYQIIGNNYLHFNIDQLENVKKIKLADMVAASSCFPAGFEPIIYPQDFSYSQKEKILTIDELQEAMLIENYQEEVSSISKPYGFMDGGITDNQGLYSAMLADNKRRKRNEEFPGEANPFDLIMVTDVTSYFMEEYDVPDVETEPKWRGVDLNSFISKLKDYLKKSAGFIQWAGILLPFFLLVSIGAIIFSGSRLIINMAYFTCGISVTVLAIIYLAKSFSPVKWMLKNKSDIQQESFLVNLVKKQKFISEKSVIRLIHYLRVTKIGLLEQMIKARITSMLTMVLEINLKQTRRLIYDIFYLETKWDNRRVPNFIYELSTYNRASRTNRIMDEKNKNRLKWDALPEDKILLLSNCEKLNEVAEVARTMGTTLWFDEDDKTNEKKQKLKKIIATGQFTTCCNLLEYFISLERKGVQFDETVNSQIAGIKKQLISDFNHFKEDPFFLYDTL
jgi:hypothetical protein